MARLVLTALISGIVGAAAFGLIDFLVKGYVSSGDIAAIGIGLAIVAVLVLAKTKPAESPPPSDQHESGLAG